MQTSTLTTAAHRSWLWPIFLLVLLFRVTPATGQDLRVIDTAHYRLHTDLDDDLTDDLTHRMEVMYDEYSRRLSEFDPPDSSAKLEVYLVHSPEKYLHLAGLALAGTGGSYNASRHLLAAFLDGQGRDALRRTLQHEAFHQFAAQAIGKNLPIWLNEGLAQIFEEGIWTGNGFILGQVPPRRLRQLHQDIADGSLVDFPRMLSMTGRDWAAHWHDPAASATQYNQAWAICHFLIYATDDSGAPKYRTRLIEMLKLLHAGQDGDAAFRAAFSSNIQGFQDRFLEYAATLGATPQATLIENQGVLADILIEMRTRGRSFDTLDDFRAVCVRERWRIEYTRGKLQWESAPDPSVYFTAPAGYTFAPDAQHFELSGSHLMPDLVCHCDGLPLLRTRFTDSDGKIEHETVADAGGD